MNGDTKNIRDRIKRTESEFLQLFSICEQVTEHLYRWRDDALPDMYDHNFFDMRGSPSESELEAAFAYQRERKDTFVNLTGAEKLPEKAAKAFELEESQILTMALLGGSPAKWTRNPQVIVRNLKRHPIREDLMALEMRNYGGLYGEDFTQRKMNRYIRMAESADGFDFFAAYLGGEIVGSLYAYTNDDCLLIDGLIVDSGARKQYVATTLMAGVIETGGRKTACLHADADDTPQEMYGRMGFTVADTVYEYLKKGGL